MEDRGLTIRIAGNSDREKWDKYVLVHPDATPYHLFGWKMAVEGAYGYKSYYLLAEKNNRISGILPVVHFACPVMLNELVALPYCDVGGVLGDSPEVMHALVAEALSLGKKLKVRSLQLRGRAHEAVMQSHNLLRKPTDKVQMMLELPESSQVMMKSFKSKLRSQIRKSEKNGLRFSWAKSGDMDGYYAVFSANMRDIGSPVHSRKWFEQILCNYQENSRLGLVFLEKKVVGGGIILMSGKKVAIPWASTLRKYNRLAPNMLLYWSILKFCCDSGFNHFDFGRSSRYGGTYKFKAQWGAVPTKLEWYSTGHVKNTADEGKVASSKKRETLEKVWQRLPLPVANFLGPKIRKYINL